MKKNIITVQKMKAAHLQDICKLSSELYQFHDKLLPDFFTPFNIEKSAQRYLDLQSKKDAIFLVAIHNNSVIGYLLGLISDKPWRQKSLTCILDEIHISQSYQHQGVGTYLMDELKKQCKRKNIKDINLNVYSPNKNAIKFYKKLGFRTTSHKMDLEID